MLEIACLVEPGRRLINDDRASVNKKLVSKGFYSETTEKACLAVVCDGVGGEKYGNEAAEIVTKTFSKLDIGKLSIDSIKNNIVKSNNAVIKAQKTDVNHSKMSTTVAGLYINENDLIAFNVGDTRIYRFRSYLSQISKDHSIRQEQIDLGLKPKQGQENVITRYIGGAHSSPEIIEGPGRVFINDLYVLCTDGVWSVLGEEDFEKLLSSTENLKKTCQAFINLALKNKSEDNLSIIIVKRF